MNNISLQDAVHKNIILWKLMRKLDFWKVRTSYDINRRAKVMSLGRPTNGESGHWCKQFNFDRLKFLDSKGNAHIYEFSNQASYIWKAGDFNFFPTGASSTIIFARAELLDHLVSNFSFGLKWKKEKLVAGYNEISQICIGLDLDFTNYDCEMEKSLIENATLKGIHLQWMLQRCCKD